MVKDARSFLPFAQGKFAFLCSPLSSFRTINQTFLRAWTNVRSCYVGRYTCVGKALALAELRTVASLLVSKYHIRFAPGEDGAQVEGDMRDQFTAAPGKLNLSFTLRVKDA